MKSWLGALEVYRDRRMLAILFMGFSSGLPLPLVYGTLSFWLREVGVSRTAIGLFVLAGLSYSFKFLWSPFVDRLPLPLLTRRMGRRRSWAIVIQLPLMVAIFALGSTDPKTQLAVTALLVVIVAFLSASQDIVIDAYRIELLAPEEQGAGAAATQWGYRFGMLAGGTGAYDAAEFGGWHFAYTIMAALMLVGIVTVLTPHCRASGRRRGACASARGSARRSSIRSSTSCSGRAGPGSFVSSYSTSSARRSPVRCRRRSTRSWASRRMRSAISARSWASSPRCRVSPSAARWSTTSTGSPSSSSPRSLACRACSSWSG